MRNGNNMSGPYARVYQDESLWPKGHWFVDYHTTNYELLPAVGVYKTYNDALISAKIWMDTGLTEDNV